VVVSYFAWSAASQAVRGVPHVLFRLDAERIQEALQPGLRIASYLAEVPILFVTSYR